ncbi:tyrosine-protein phosphatase [Aspergillus stella-maris]|uniref:tyrosine-protein phosphatase n=1 Tax=Aspergillus stella-maris TaxID=1810926 RepID=UPI003CCDA5DF
MAAQQQSVALDSGVGTAISIDGVFNVRSFGGYPSSLAPNTITRHGRIYRAGHLRDITLVGLTQLHDLGINTIIDLTNSGETKALFTDEPDGTTAQCKVLNLPLAKHAFSVKGLSEKYKRYLSEGERAVAQSYLTLLTDGAPVLRDILLYIRDHPEDTLLIHCAMGKDRTGVIFAVLLSLAGVPSDTIAEEYALSEAALGEALPEIAAAIKKAMPVVDDIGAMERARIVIKTSKKAMALTLQLIEEESGGVLGYVMKCCELGVVDIKRVQHALTGPSNGAAE